MTKEELEKEAEEYYEDETEGTFQICEDCYWFADAVQTAYVDSAEPREKRIEELEHKLEQTEKDLADYQFNYPTIKALEKENAELIHENARLVTVIDKSKSCGISPLNYLIIKNLDDQLTKAKEIIKLLLHALKNEGSDYTFALENTHPVLAEAEQFLKEE